MSLFSRPPHTITVYPVVEVDDGYGGTMPGEGSPITLKALVQPLSGGSAREQEDDSAHGYDVETRFQVVARSLPASAWSRVTWNGVDLHVDRRTPPVFRKSRNEP